MTNEESPVPPKLVHCRCRDCVSRYYSTSTSVFQYLNFPLKSVVPVVSSTCTFHQCLYRQFQVPATYTITQLPPISSTCTFHPLFLQIPVPALSALPNKHRFKKIPGVTPKDPHFGRDPGGNASTCLGGIEGPELRSHGILTSACVNLPLKCHSRP